MDLSSSESEIEAPVKTVINTGNYFDNVETSSSFKGFYRDPTKPVDYTPGESNQEAARRIE